MAGVKGRSGRRKATTAPQTLEAARLRELRARPLIEAERKINEQLRAARAAAQDGKAGDGST